MRFQKISNGLGLVGREIVENDVDLLLRPALRHHLSEEIHEVGTGVAGRRFPMHSSGFGVQRSVERQRAMAIILEPVALSATRRERQHGVQTIERLNRGLFIYTEDGRMLRRVQIEPDDIGGFAFEVRIVAGHVAFQAVRLQSRFPPYPMHHVLAHVDRSGQLAATPVRGTVFRFSACHRQNLGPQGGRQHHRRLSRMIGVQPFQSILNKTLFPARNRWRGGLQSIFDDRERHSIGQHQNQLGAKHKSGRKGTELRNLVQISSLFFG